MSLIISLGGAYRTPDEYVSGRVQTVLLNSKWSQWSPVTAGVPQGSILAPLLFLIFSNDIVDDLKSDPSLYTDDTPLMKEITSPRDVLSL